MFAKAVLNDSLFKAAGYIHTSYLPSSSAKRAGHKSNGKNEVSEIFIISLALENGKHFKFVYYMYCIGNRIKIMTLFLYQEVRDGRVSLCVYTKKYKRKNSK